MYKYIDIITQNSVSLHVSPFPIFLIFMRLYITIYTSVFFLGSQVSQVVRQTTPRLLVGPASRDQLSSTRWNLSVTVASAVMSSASVLEHGKACCHFAAREVSKNSHGF